MTGLTLAQYRIDEELGRGGMGIVFKATDTKLNRVVALKVLPASALASEDDRARFFREAQSAAQLHHPNIATVFQIDEAIPLSEKGERVTGQDEPRLFIAMEYVEGDTLYDRIKKGPFPLRDAVNVAGQIAEALKEAHAKDIVHRDIKSANVMLTKDGVAKVLDFGLAKTNQSTMLTRMGSTLGTVAYMSPEQARGHEVDGRTDLYALGTVLYEMVAGRLPFAGDYEQAVLYAILNEPPEPLTALRTGVPMDLERITSKLLAKEADYRYQTAGGLLADLKSLDVTGSGVSRRSMAAVSSPAIAAPSKRSFPIRTLGMVAAALLIGAVGAWLLKPAGVSAPSGAVLKARMMLPDARSPLEASLTPDDRLLFYAAVNPARIIAYDLASGQTRDVERSQEGRHPVVSPDGRWVMFHHLTAQEWWRAPVAGGLAAPIKGGASRRRVPAGFDEQGRFTFSDSAWALSMPSQDGSLVQLAAPDTADGPNGLVLPVGSPEGSFTIYSSGGLGFVPLNVWRTRGGGERDLVMPGSFAHALTTSGHLLTIQESLLNAAPQTYATPINLKTGELEGATVALGARSYPAAVSPSGLLVFEELGNQSGQARPSTLYKISSSGTAEPVAPLPGVLASEFAISASGEYVVVGALPELRADTDIFLVDLSRSTVTRLTRDGGYDLPVWGPGDRQVYFDQSTPDGYVILRRNADGTGVNERILPEIEDIGDQSLTPDGALMAFNDGPLNLWVHDFRADSSRMVLDESEALYKPTLSPDGRYLAFVRAGDAWCGSIEVVASSGEGVPIPIMEQGCMPKWSKDGSAIYTELKGEISRVPVTTDPVFSQTGPAEVIFRGPAGFQTGTDGAMYFDVDGDGVVWVTYPEAGGGSREVWVVSNWFTELNEIAPRDP